jgi:hypothetical protein
MKFKVGDIVVVEKSAHPYDCEIKLIGKIGRVIKAPFSTERNPFSLNDVQVEWLEPLSEAFIKSIINRQSWMTAKNWILLVDQIRRLNGLERARAKANEI